MIQVKTLDHRVNIIGPQLRVGVGVVRFVRETMTSQIQSRSLSFLTTYWSGKRSSSMTGRSEISIRAIGPDKVVVEIVQARAKGSTLGAEKGINLPESDLRVSPLTEDDIEALEFVAKHADSLGYSFVRTESDIRDLQARLDKLGGKQPVITTGQVDHKASCTPGTNVSQRS